jgi:geranylgeranyl diphosphate synthase type II
MSSPSERKAAEAAFRDFLDRAGTRVDRLLADLLPSLKMRPAVVHRAMRYTTLAPGKRLRPALVLLSYESCGGKGRRADPVAAALEMVHAFSLIHDDLPAMDDDDYRRGKPSNHKVFGEGVAVLAGDALLPLAFETIARQRRRGALGPAVTATLVEELARATGTGGVIGGQVEDLLAEGQAVSRGTLRYIHVHKTACLFSCAVRLGGISAGASTARLRSLSRYGLAMGEAFQLVDDILNEAGSVRELGRDPGRDRERQKAAAPRILGLPASHRAVDRCLRSARAETARLGTHRELFAGCVELVDRRRRDGEGALLAGGYGP